jgi:putative membrane protein
MDWGAGWYGMIFGPLLMILALVVVIGVALSLVRGFGGARRQTPPPMPPRARRSTFLRSGTRAARSTGRSSKERRRVLGD